MSKKEKKKIKIDKRLFIVIIIILILILGVGGYFLYQYFEFKKPLKEEWGQKYYVYLKNIKENKKNKEAGLPEKLKNSKIGFYEVNDVKDPIMIIEYEKNKETYTNMYYIKNEKVNNIVYKEPTEIEFLYNIENKTYNYYAHTKDEESDTYSNVLNKINNQEDNYTFEKDEKDSVIDENGKEISISKYDETFIKPKIKDNKLYYNTSLKESKLKDTVKKGIDKYMTADELKDYVTELIEEQLENINKLKEEIKNAQTELEKQQQEEKRKAEEQAKGLQVGGETVKYGTYVGQEFGSGFTLILNSDNTAKLNDTNYTFTVETYNFAQDSSSDNYQEAIVLKNSDGSIGFAVYPSDGKLVNGTMIFVYKN